MRYNDKVRKKIELVVIVIYTIFMCAMFVSSLLLGWGIWSKEGIVATVAISWWLYLKKYKNSDFRAKCYTAAIWLDFGIYVFHSHNFTSMLCTMSAIIVLLGLFYIPNIVYAGMAMTTVVFLYNGLIAKTINLSTASDILRAILHIITGYAISLIMLIMIRIQQDVQEQLLENIKELKVAERGKDDFMANISHEIRTPVNAVCGLSEAILQEDIPIEIRRDVIDIQTAGRNLLSAVSNMLDFSELESGSMALVEESFNITSTITDIINMALTFGNGRKLELIVDCDANLPSYMLGDEQKLRRVIVGLLDNAIKFTKEGGVILRIRGRKEEYGLNLLVSVKDSGIGIAREDMERIFTSFSQVDSKRNREEGGVGLGLAIAQALVKSMGGFISVESALGVGSEFKFAVPLKVLDETPIVSIKNKSRIFAACYINMEKYNYSVVREGYEKCIRHIVEQFGILIRICRNLQELKRRMEREDYTHIFISWEEYCEDKKFFDRLSEDVTAVLILDYDQESMAGRNMLRIYKPFTVLSIAAVFNGQKVAQADEHEQHLTTHKHFIAPSAHVLVVDDNVMNLKVMARLLLPYQIKVTMAGSGKEALEKLDEMEFDCVFLDHMMPEMDGVETLHKIRQKPGLYFQSLKVIAFTANAIGGAREMFLSEGFDDFIAKPIELSVLERLLRRYILPQKQIIVEGHQAEASGPAGRGKEAGEEKESFATAQEASAPMEESKEDRTKKAFDELELAGIDTKQGIAYCGDEEGFQEILSIYCEEGGERREKLTQMFQEEDWKNYVITVHALKGNSKGIGANELAEQALGLEMAGKEDRIDYILEHHGEFMERYGELLEALEGNAFVCPEGKQADAPGTPDKEAGEPDREAGVPDEEAGVSDGEAGEPDEEAGAPEVDRAWVGGQIAKLKEKLDSFEGEGIEEILDGLARCPDGGLGLAEMAEAVRDRVDEFDFLGAAETLGAWEERSGVAG